MQEKPKGKSNISGVRHSGLAVGRLLLKPRGSKLLIFEGNLKMHSSKHESALVQKPTFGGVISRKYK